jgi:pimeloyl-ACP methyl ester carboxylesterase
MVPTALLLFPWILRHFDEMAICEFPGYAGKLLGHRPLSSSSELSFELRLLQKSIRPTHLVGHSMGGAMAAFLATDSALSQEQAARTSSPGLKQLILMNPAGLYPSRAAQAKIEGLFLRAHQQGHLDGLRDKFFFKEPPGFRWSIPAVKKFVSAPEIRMLLEEGKKPIPAHDDLNHRLKHLTVPTHILWGKDDQLIPSRFFKLWKEKIPKDSLRSGTQILNCGHAPQTERPAITAALLYELLINQKPPQGIDPANRKLAPFLKIPTRLQSEIKPYPGHKLKDLSRND